MATKPTKDHTKGRLVECCECHRQYLDYSSPSEIKKQPNRTCSRKCFSEHMRKLALRNKPKGSFKKGHEIPQTWKDSWSVKRKGRTGYWKGKKRVPFSEEWKRNLGNAHRNPSVETRKKKSEVMRGEKNHQWRGGLTSENRCIRRSLEYRLWRESVFSRDNWTCVWCGVRSQKGGRIVLHADHIKPFANYPELRFAIDNGRTLCKECHKKTDNWGWKNRWKK